MSGYVLAQQTYRARVVDAETGEPLPYASVYVSEKKSALTNPEGFYSVELNKGESLRISAIGYSTETMAADQSVSLVKLNPLVPTGETVEEGRLRKTMETMAKHMGKEYRRHAFAKRMFFHRISIHVGDRHESAEVLQTSQSALSIGDTYYWCGRRNGTIGEAGTDAFYSHMCDLSELGPAIVETDKWKGIIQPFHIRLASGFDRTGDAIYSEYSGPPGPAHPIFKVVAVMDYENFRYDAEGMKDSKGNGIYKIDMRYVSSGKGETRRLINGMYLSTKEPACILEGTAYVDARKKQLLAFEGRLMGYIVPLSKGSQDGDIRLKIMYTHERGYTEVESLACTAQSGELLCTSALLNIRDMVNQKMHGKDGQTTFIRCLEENGNDVSPWPRDVILPY